MADPTTFKINGVVVTEAEYNASVALRKERDAAVRALRDTASTQTAGDAVNNSTRPTGPEAGSTSTKPAPTATQNIDGGSIKYVVGEGGAQTILIYDQAGQILGAGVDIGQAMEAAAKRGASPGFLNNVATEYQSAGQATIDDLTQQLNNPYYAEDKQDAAIEAATGRVSTNLDKNDRLLASENRRAGLNDNGIGEPGMLPPSYVPKRAPTDDGRTGTNTSQVISSDSGVVHTPAPNPLHEYASYTYNLSLHVLGDTEYNNLIENPNVSFKPRITIIGGAGRYGNQRDPAFKDDFFFDDLKMTTVIGLNHETRGGNTVELSFTILEPYGMTLLNRMLDLSVRMKKPNYLDIPYLLEISFFGADDTGNYAKLGNHTKFIPIRLTTAKIKASTKGSQYQITAIPYNKISNMQSMQTTKANFEITSRTVGEYFYNGAKDFATVQKDTADTVRYISAIDASNIRETESRKAAGQTGSARLLSTSSSPIVVKGSSFADAYNIWQMQEALHGYMDEPDEIIFDIHKDIASATIIEPKTANPRNLENQPTNPGASAQTSGATKASAPKSVGADFTKSFFNINAGTAITTVLNNMIINSTFITNQLTNSETDAKDIKTTSNNPDAIVKATGGKKDVIWFKITSKVELKKYDSRRGYSAKKITFYVTPYTHYNASSPDAPKSQPRGYIKQYDYIYTGLNSDILDFSLDFNTLFNTLVVVDRSKQTVFNTNPGVGSPADVVAKAEVLQNNSITPTQKVLYSGIQTSMTGGSLESSVKQQAAVLAENIYIGAAGDMLTLNLKIVGDPQFIKQDEILFSQTALKNSKSQYIGREGGSLSMDTGEIFCKVTFKTPVDIDEQTGLIRKDSAWETAYFSGLFKVIKVTSEFRGGRFVQDLVLVRHRNQIGDSKGSVTDASGKSIDERKKLNPNDKTTNSKVVGKSGDVAFTDFETGETYVITNDNRLLGPGGKEIAVERVGTPKSNIGITLEETQLPNDSDPNHIPLKEVANNGKTATIDQGINF